MLNEIKLAYARNELRWPNSFPSLERARGEILALPGIFPDG